MSPTAARPAASRPRVLVIDDAESVRIYLANLLSLRGFEVDTAENGRRGLALLEGGAAPDLILLDVMMPGWDGLETLRRIRSFDAEVPVVVLSVVGTASTIVEAMRLGATDYFNKPLDEAELDLRIQSALELRRLAEERDHLTEGGTGHREAVWNSEPMIRIRDLIERIAETDVTVLIQGESGVGKEVVARSIHQTSPRVSEPFVKVNCSALPDNLLESELFGYEKGAFTGAHGRKQGKFELAHRGTIFLDEIGEMSPGLQAKLLQVLQDSEFTRLGGHREVRVDVRVLCATHRRLDEMIREGTFREDLFFRLNVVNVSIPPLRERREEIPGLAERFLHRFSARYGRPPQRPSAKLLAAFERHLFPGNVRELENMIKRIVVLESEAPILQEIREAGRGSRNAADSLRRLIEEVEKTAGEVPLREVGRRASQEAERQTIRRVLEHTDWNRKEAARLVGVSYKTLLQKIRDCGLEPG